MVAQDNLGTRGGKQAFSKIVSAVDLNKCLKRLKIPISPHTCAPISELPFDIVSWLVIYHIIIESIFVSCLNSNPNMALILDGNSEHAAHA